MPGKCKYNSNWSGNKEIKNVEKWLRPVDDCYQAKCLVCNSTFDVSNSGIASVKKHAIGKIHLSKLDANQPPINFFRQSTTSEETPPACSSLSLLTNNTAAGESSSCNITEYVNKQSVACAEIRWILNKVVRHLSLRDSENACDLFKIMFPDSDIASKIKLHKDKTAYVVTYGLRPFFQGELVKVIQKCDYFSVSFDESLNKVAQKGQMDIHVRYWNCTENEVTTQYLTSTFMGHACAGDLLQMFIGAFSNLGLSVKKIRQISMDGPNVNFAFLREYKSYIKEISSNDDVEIIDIGSCSLHLVHGSYKTAHNKSNWHINKFLRSIYYLLKDHPSRRADYIYFSKSNKFPLKMCTIRWVENSNVIARAIEIVPNLKKYIEGTKCKPPQTNNYGIVQSFLKDDLLLAKLQFLQTIALQLEPFLTEFQSNKPLLPFMNSDLYALMKNLLKRFIKKEKIDNIKNSAELLAINVALDSNHLPAKSIDIGFGASSCCRNLKEIDVLRFRNECKHFMVILVEHLNKKSPLRKKFVKGASCLSPNVMLSSVRSSRIKIALEELCEYNMVSYSKAEKIKQKYLEICDNKTIQKQLEKFNRTGNRLDTFFVAELNLNNEDNKEFFDFVKLILVCFHGNAAVERGFSVNADCLVENLEENSLIAQRSCIAAVDACGGVPNVDITRCMLSAYFSSSAKRNEAIKEKKKKQDESESMIKTVALEIASLKESKKRLMEKVADETNQIDSEIMLLSKKLKK